MAKHVLEEPAYVNTLVNALLDAMPTATVECELAVTNRYRIMVTWVKFDDLGHPDRQTFVWNIAEKVLTADDLLKVSAILTFAPSDFPV